MQKGGSSGYRNLKVWTKAMDAMEAVGDAVDRFPKYEMYGLSSQLRRASYSVPSNIAEGYNRGGRNYPRFLIFARGSSGEVETQIEIAARRKYLDKPAARELWKRYNEIGRMLTGLIQRLQADLDEPEEEEGPNSKT